VLKTISIGAGAKVIMGTPDAHADRSILVLNTLSIAQSSGQWQGQLDLAANDLIVQAGDLTTIHNQISSGYNGGNWIGQGIISTASANDPANLTKSFTGSTDAAKVGDETKPRGVAARRAAHSQ